MGTLGFRKLSYTFNQKFSLLTAALSVALFTAAHTAQAETPAIDPKNSGSNYYQGAYSLGFAFTVNSALSVTALGYYDADQNGLNATHAVGIYDSSCNLIASTVVAVDDPLIGSFRYHAITPVELPAGNYYAAAVTNGGDPYLISASSLEADSRIGFGGFVIHSYSGDTSLACPNGPGADPNFKGDFGPNFLISDGSLPPDATPTPTPNKHKSACKLFCNRTGLGGFTPDGLNTADCFVTIANGLNDVPGLVPSGVVNFTATDGFLPGEGQCALVRGPQSASCNFKLSIPSVPPFPIGVRFPIGIQYPGDENFGACSDGHHLLVTLCFEQTQEGNTCKRGVSVNSKNKPKISTSGILMSLVECGGDKATPSPAGKQELCIVDGSYSTTLALTLQGLTGSLLLKLGEAITDRDIKKFPALKFIRDAKKKYNAGELTLILSSLSDINKLLKGKRTSIETGGLALPLTAKLEKKGARRPSTTSFDLGTLKARVRVGTIAEKKVKASKEARQIFSILKRGGITEIPVNIKLTAKRTDTKKKTLKSKTTETVTLE